MSGGFCIALFEYYRKKIVRVNIRSGRPARITRTFLGTSCHRAVSPRQRQSHAEYARGMVSGINMNMRVSRYCSAVPARGRLPHPPRLHRGADGGIYARILGGAECLLAHKNSRTARLSCQDHPVSSQTPPLPGYCESLGASDPRPILFSD